MSSNQPDGALQLARITIDIVLVSATRTEIFWRDTAEQHDVNAADMTDLHKRSRMVELPGTCGFVTPWGMSSLSKLHEPQSTV